MTKTKEKTDYILFENYIYPKILKYLKKKVMYMKV